ncbi:MAG: cell division protein FtsZ [Bacteroidales bacterium]|nr:cell division protein FtsZ [Bacteroidales bacterium]
MITFQPKQHPSYIKVLGVGGGGTNAVNHMFKQGITGVEFAICNTDVQALESSPVPTKIEIGNKDGLGAGANPEVGRTAAEGSIEKIKELLNDTTTKMLFITAGMGGGTGTGAAPVIAELAHELGILTVGIVTLPFHFEGRKRRKQAEVGIEEMRKHVDSLLVISNDKLRQQFGDLVLSDAFAKADNVLTTAAKGIAELITVTGYVNVDFEDVKTVMKNSGRAIMGSARAEGENRAIHAIEQAMNSPLLNDNEVKGATSILLYIMTGANDITMDEITEITEYVTAEVGVDADLIWGTGTDETLGNQIGITIIATGFETVKQVEEATREATIVGVVGTSNKGSATVKTEVPSTPKITAPEPTIELKTPVASIQRPETVTKPEKSPEPTDSGLRHTLETDTRETTIKNQSNATPISLIRHSEKSYLSVGHTVSSDNTATYKTPVAPKLPENEEEAISKNAAERINKLKTLSINLRSAEKVDELERQPAYLRKNYQIDETSHSSDTVISRFTLGEDSKNQPVIKSDNSFLHDNVD